MRPLKFRVWSPTYKTMLYPEQRAESPLINIRGESISRIAGEFIFQQFTGLLDKNGKEIYEGDIMKWQDLYGIHSESVEWADYSYKPFYDPRDGGIESGETEILGNLYETPELLPK